MKDISVLLDEIVSGHHSNSKFIAYDSATKRAQNIDVEGDCPTSCDAIKVEDVWGKIALTDVAPGRGGQYRYLVRPRGRDFQSASTFLNQIENVEGYSVFCIFSQGNKKNLFGLLFEPNELSGYRVKPLELGPGMVAYWSFEESNYFYPDGLEHPFEERRDCKDFFFPSLMIDEYCLWESKKDQPQIHRGIEQEPFLKNIELVSEEEVVTSRETDNSIFPYFPLEVRRDYLSETKWSSRALIRIEAGNQSLTEPILNMLDRAEASVESITYYNHKRFDGPYAPIEHYFLIESNSRSSDRFFPESSVFKQPLSFYNQGVEVFLQSNLKFVPDLPTLLEDEYENESLKKITNLFSSAEKSDITVVRSLPNSKKPYLLHLSGGVALKNIVSEVMDAWPENISREYATQLEPSLQRHLRKHVQASEKIIEHELNHYEAELSKYFKIFEGEIDEYVAKEKEIKTLLSNIKKFRLGAQACADSAQQGWADFVDGLMSISRQIAHPSRKWLKGINGIEDKIVSQQKDLFLLLLDHGKESSRLVEKIEGGKVRLEGLTKKIILSRDGVAKKERELVAREKKFIEAERRAESDLRAIANKVNEFSANLEKSQARFIERQGVLQRRSVALHNQEGELEQQLAYQKSESERLSRKEQKITQLRDTDIPQKKNEIMILDQRIKALAAESIEGEWQRLVESEKRLKHREAGLLRKKEAEEDLRDQLKEDDKKLLKVEKEVLRLKRRNMEDSKELRKRRTQANSDRAKYKRPGFLERILRRRK